MKAGNGVHKGKRFEREIARKLQRVFPDARRRAMQARGGHEGSDIDGTPRWWFELGHGKRMNAADKYAQAVRDCGADPTSDLESRTPAAITRRDNGFTLVTLDLDDFLDVLSSLQYWTKRVDALQKQVSAMMVIERGTNGD